MKKSKNEVVLKRYKRKANESERMEEERLFKIYGLLNVSEITVLQCQQCVPYLSSYSLQLSTWKRGKAQEMELILRKLCFKRHVPYPNTTTSNYQYYSKHRMQSVSICIHIRGLVTLLLLHPKWQHTKCNRIKRTKKYFKLILLDKKKQKRRN